MILIILLVAQAAAALAGVAYAMVLGVQSLHGRTQSAKAYGYFYVAALLAVVTMMYVTRILAEMPHA